MPAPIGRRRGRWLNLLPILVPVVFLLAILPHPSPHRPELAALSKIQTIHKAQKQYLAQYGRFARRLEELGPPAGGPPGPQAADLIPADLVAGRNAIYQLEMLGGPSGYSVSARPLVLTTASARTFYSDQTGVIRQARGAEPATSQSPEIR